MLTAKQGKEAVVQVGSEIGVLAQITKTISEKGIDLFAVCAWEEGDRGIIRLVTEDHRRTMDILEDLNLDPIEGEVVIMTAPHHMGTVNHIASVLSGYGISIKCIYGSTTINDDECSVVMATSDTDKTVIALNM